MDPKLSRRVGQVMAAPVIRDMSPEELSAFRQAVAKAKSFDTLGPDYKATILQAESQAKAMYHIAPKTVKFKVSSKGSSKSGNYGHAGRLGKVGGSAPKSKGNDNIVQAKYNKPQDLPSYKEFDPYDPPRLDNQDATLKLILHDQGYDGLPDVVSKEEMDKYVEDGETEIFRGMQGHNAQQFAKQFREGDLFVGMGSHGSGTYSSTEVGTAWGYSGHGKGVIVRMTLKSGSKIIDEDKVDILRNKETVKRQAYYEAEEAKLDKSAPDWAERFDALDLDKKRARRMISGDNGRWAASHGYDAIRIDTFDKELYYVILNRTALRVQSTNYQYEE